MNFGHVGTVPIGSTPGPQMRLDGGPRVICVLFLSERTRVASGMGMGLAELSAAS